MNQQELSEYLKRVLALSRIGLSYTENPFDIERYEELRDRTIKMIESLSGFDKAAIDGYFSHLDPYPTPKVDTRSIVLRGSKILLVREQSDGKWAMPGGWTDIGYTPSENAIKEVFEESGLKVKLVRLLSVWDKRVHNHPSELNYVYKLNFLCEEIGGELKHGFDMEEVGFFEMDNLPPLSLDRNTEKQIRTLVELSLNPTETVFD